MSKPWKSEPNEKSWTAHGYDCALRRGPVGAWCGYVALPEGHPLHGAHYTDEKAALAALLEKRKSGPMPENPGLGLMLAVLMGPITATMTTALDVHGGVTYTDDHCPGREPDGQWWVGFDCAHAGDFCPEYAKQMPGVFADEPEDSFSVYRDIDFATQQTERLAEQLAAASTPATVDGVAVL